MPEYYITRTELGLFQRAGAEMIAAASGDEPLTLVELGAGTAKKTQVLLEALLSKQPSATFYPVDVSAAALDHAVSELSARFPALEVVPVVAPYQEALANLSGHAGRKLVLFIGSSIGNFDPEEAIALLSQLRSTLTEGDALLLGTDLLKDPRILLPAYDDPAGITARFNKNVLARINRELGGHFDLDKFHHVAIWNEDRSRIELYLQSQGAQVVRIDALEWDVRFEDQERVHTESSYKFTLPLVDRILEESGFIREQTWMDARRLFAEHLARVQVH
jgi:L-histidine Nalpha-methyltransferase